MRISDWSSDVCSSDLLCAADAGCARHRERRPDIPIGIQVSGPRCGRADRGRDGARDPSGTARKRGRRAGLPPRRSEEHTSELQSLMRISYAVFCLKQNNIVLYINTNLSDNYYFIIHLSKIDYLNLQDNYYQTNTIYN